MLATSQYTYIGILAFVIDDVESKTHNIKGEEIHFPDVDINQTSCSPDNSGLCHLNQIQDDHADVT